MREALAAAGGEPAAGAVAGPAGAGAGSDAGGAAGVGHAAAGGKAQAQRAARCGPLTMFYSMLTAYLAYLALADDVARAAFLRELAGFKPTVSRCAGPPVRHNSPGSYNWHCGYYGPNEELGLALFLGAFDDDAVGLARTALADTPPSDGTTFRLHGALL